jgi:hypothetical protein
MHDMRVIFTAGSRAASATERSERLATWPADGARPPACGRPAPLRATDPGGCVG